MMLESKDLSAELKLSHLKTSLDKANAALDEFTKLAKGSEELREWATNEIAQYALSIRSSKLDKDELENFFKYPYCILPGKHEGECYLAIPKFVDSHFGWLHKVTPSFNIFLVNQYVDWLGELPAALKKEMKFADPLDVHLDNDYIVGPDTAKLYDKHPQFFTKQKDGRLLVDKSRHFEMLAALIKDGILPFIPKPVAKADLVERRCDIQLRDYQLEAWKEFLKYSNIGAFFPPSTGKTYLSIHALTHIVGPNLVAVPSRLLVEQWVERLELYTDLRVGWWENETQRKHVFKELEEGRIDVVVCTYQSATKHSASVQFKLLIIDEVHHLPSNEFSKLSTVKREYTIGLSATPQREDEREEFIFALTGKPVGLAWEVFKKLGIIQNPPMHVWIVKNEIDRIKQIEKLLNEQIKTIIFCDSIELGKTVSKRFNVPHIHGGSKEKLAAMKDALVSVVSRVGDEGVSLSDIQRVIEISWLHGSRRQELQRFTRLLHGKNTKGEAHIVMTGQEYQTDHKRLFGLMDKGFKIVLHRDGEKEKSFDGMPRNVVPQKTIPQEKRIVQTSKPQESQEVKFETQHAILKLPGVLKLAAKLKPVELKAVDAFYRMDNQPFSSLRIARLLGYTNVKNSHISFGKLTDLGFIKKVKEGYQASPETLAG